MIKDFEAIKYIFTDDFKEGIHVDRQNHKGVNAMMIACRQGNLKLVKYLRKREKGDLFFSDKKRRNCLFYAVRSGNLALVQYLAS